MTFCQNLNMYYNYIIKCQYFKGDSMMNVPSNWPPVVQMDLCLFCLTTSLSLICVTCCTKLTKNARQ